LQIGWEISTFRNNMLRRRQSREAALQMLFQQDLNPDVDYHTIREQIRERVPDEDLYEFAWQLFMGVIEHRIELDAKIEAIAQNWSLKRMAATDRNALRLGAFEILYTQTPPRVVIDEALELAKMFGSGQSAPFVNGILDRMIPAERRGELVSSEEVLPEENTAP
jgi:N utilization substance protein B